MLCKKLADCLAVRAEEAASRPPQHERLKFFSCTALVFLLLTHTAFADQLIVEPDDGRKPILNLIAQARHSLDVVMYGFTDKTLRQALLDQQKKGKSVKIILEKYPYKAEHENRQTIQQFNQHGVAWQPTSPLFRLTHQKTLIVDDKKAMIMTFNFTRSTFKNDRNFALIIDDPKRVNAIAAMFTADWNRHPTANQATDLLYSPDNSRRVLLTLIQQAKRSIKMYAQTINDYQMVGALAKAARRGVKVEIITSSTLHTKQANYLSRAGVIFHRSMKRYIHAKALSIDNRQAVIGSINLTRSSLNDNRELSMITQDPTVLKQLDATFEQDKA